VILVTAFDVLWFKNFLDCKTLKGIVKRWVMLCYKRRRFERLFFSVITFFVSRQI